MKMRRILASLLCLVMVVCSFPMIASASVSENLYDTIGELMGRESSRPVDNATWKSMNLDFTNNFSDTTNVKTTNASGNAIDFTEGGFAYDNTNGLAVTKGDYRVWRYFPAGLESQGWSPLVFGAYYLRFKLEEGGTLEPEACAYYQHARSFVQLSNTGVNVWSNKNNDGLGADGSDRSVVANINDYVPGTDWNQMVVVANGGSANSTGGYSVYMKKDADANFTLVASTNGYRGGGSWRSTGLGLGGQGYAVSDAVMLEGSDVRYTPLVTPTDIPYAAIGKALGGEYSEAHPGDSNWAAMNLNFMDSFDASQATGLTAATGITFDNEKGVTFPDTSAALNYFVASYQNKWTPMAHGNWGFRFKLIAGGAINAQAAQLWGNVGRMFADISTTGVTIYDGGESGTGMGAVTNLVNYKPGVEWNDILFVANANGGYDTYMKKASDAEFTLVASTTSYRSGGSMNGGGAQIVASKANVSYMMCFKTAEAPNEVDNTPNPGITDDLKGAIGKVLGAAYAAPATSSSDWPAMNLDFTGSFDTTQDGMKISNAVTFDAVDGAVFGAAPSDASAFNELRYRPTVTYNGWSPLCISGNYTFNFKLDSNGAFQVQSPKVWNNNRVYIDFTKDSVTVWDGGDNSDSQRVVTNLVDYKPGIVWNDVMIVAGATDGYDVYMKKATDAEFTHVASAPTYRKGNAWGSTGFSAVATNAKMGYAVSWVGAEAPLPNNPGNGATPGLDELNAAGVALGAKSIEPCAGLVFDFVGAGTSYVQPDGVESATEITYGEAGLTFGAAQGNWKYNPSLKWCPFSYGSVVYFKAKANEEGYVIVQAYLPTSDHFRAFLEIRPTGATVPGASGVTEHAPDFKPGTGFVEYMIYKGTDNVQEIYAKGGSATEWTKLYTITTWRNNGYNGGLNFTGVNAVVPYAAMANPSDVEQVEILKDNTPNPGITDGLKAAIGKVLGADFVSAKPATSTADWPAMNLDFTGEFNAGQDGVNLGTGITFDAVDGMVFPETAVDFRYRPTVQHNGWSPLCVSQNYTFNFKVDSNGTFEVQSPGIWTGNRAFVVFNSEGVVVWQNNETGDGMAQAEKLVDYKPGIVWNDVMIKTNTNGGYDVYAKKATDADFTLVASTTSYRQGGAWNSTGFSVNAKNAKMGYAVSWVGTELSDNTPNPGITADLKAAIGKVLGSSFVSAKPAVSSADWPAMNLDFTGSFDATQDGVNTGTGITYDAVDGLVFPETDAVFKYRPAVPAGHNGWSPLCVSGNYTFRFKLNYNGQIMQESPQIWANNRTYLTFTPSGVIVYDGGEAGGGQRVSPNLVNYEPGIEWNDVMVTTNTAGGYDVYMKKATDAEFTKVNSTVNYRLGNGAWGNSGFTATAKSAKIAYAVSWVGQGPVDNIPNPGITSDLKSAIAKVLGSDYVSAKPATSSSDWPAMNLDFSGSFDATQDGVTSTGLTFDAVDGVVFPATNTMFRYRPTVKHNGWSPLCISNNYTFNFKLDSDGKLQTQASKVWSGNDRVYIDFTPESVVVWGRAEGTDTQGVSANLVDYKPGIGWNDVMITANANGGYDVYMKKATDSEYTLVNSTTTFRPGNAWNSGGFSVYAENAKMGYAVSWVGSTVVPGSLEDIMNGPVVSTYAFDFDESFDAKAWERGGKLTSPSGATYSDENGLDMTTAAAEASWNYYAYSGWSPMSAQPPWGTGYVPQSVYFKMKGSMQVQFRSPNNIGIFQADISPNNVIGTGNAAISEDYGIKTDSGWMEYLVVPDATVAGYTLYVKGQTATGGKWEKAKVATSFATSDDPKVGISFNGNSGMVKSVRVYQTGISNSAATAGTNARLWFQDDMSKKISFTNVSDNGVVYRDGYANFPAVSGGEKLKYELNDVVVPVGGYVEFKTRSNGNQAFTIGDGTNGVKITLYKDYGEVSGVGTFVADASNTWRTYRVVRTAQGYSVYSKVEDDKAWLLMSENVSANVTSKGISLTFESHANGTDVGNGQLDYVKVYGPDSAQDDIVLMKGTSLNAITGNKLSPDLGVVSASVKQDPNNERSLFFVKYDENGFMIGVQEETISAGNDYEMVYFDVAEKGDKTKTLKLFAWGGDSGFKPSQNVLDFKGGLSSWADDWTLVGGAEVVANKIHIASSSNEESYGEYVTSISDQFDISWSMKVSTYSGQENVQIYTGTRRYQLAVKEDGVVYNTKTGTATLDWTIGNEEHEYRVVGEGETGTLYIDGFLVGILENIELNSESSKIRFLSKGVSDVEFSNVCFNDYAPDTGFYDTFDNGDLCGWGNPATKFTVSGKEFTKQWINSTDGKLVVEDYHLAQSPNYCVTSSSKAISEIGDEFVIQTKIRFSSWGTESYMVTEVGGKQLKLDLREKYFSVGVDNGYSTEISDELLLGTTDAHVITIESYNRMNNARIYLNGTLIQDTPLATATDGLNRVYFQANGGWYLPATMEIEYFKYTPKYYQIKLTAPANNATYYVGDSVTVSATENAKFMLNGVQVATGTSATLKNLAAGRYQLVAESGNKVSDVIQFVVKEKASAVLQASQSGTTMTASLGSVSAFDSVAKVSYFMDGIEVGSATSNPYQVSISNVTAESHMVEAVAYDKSGGVVGNFKKEMPALISGNTTTAFANEISYTVSGDGVALVQNGTHKLQLTHKSSKVTYLSDAGSKSYTAGAGNFKILTDGPYAEVYRNGQYIFGFRMPKSTEVGTSFTGAITGGSVVVPAERNNYFVARNLNVQNAVYQLAGISHNHNLDFVASPTDAVQLVLNDGYYRNNITLKNGRIYVWEAEKNNSVPKEKEVKKMSSGDIYYRVETVAGMSRLYADGKWIYTFRNGNVAGEQGILAVNVTGGDGLSYLSVNQSQDLYLLNDTFDKSGEFNSVDYWMTNDAMTVAQSGEDLLLTSSSSTGIAELSASAGKAEMTANVTVNSGTRGFWFIANHSVTDSYTKVGYNFSSSQYEIIDVVKGSSASKVTAKASLSRGTKYTMKLVVEETYEGKCVSLYVNGNKVISKNDSLNCRGRIGFMVSRGSASLSDIDYRGDAKPMLDMRDNPIKGGTTTLDMIETSEKTYMLNGSGGYSTTDGGKTWEKFTLSAGNGLSTETGVGVTENTARLANGEIVSMVTVAPPGWRDEYDQRRGYIRPYISKDDGMNWSHIGTASFPPEVSEDTLDSLPLQGRGATVNAVSQGPSGRVYFVYGGGNSEDYGFTEVWMSDNNGRSWFKSMTQIDALQTGYVIAEAKVIETTRNTRLYFRTDKGQIAYFESYDLGETWDMIPHTTPFISSMTCFSVEADPENPDTLYIGWGYDTINLYARPQFPRTRWAVAKSTDSGNTWEMVGTVHENNSIEHNMMNLNINVGKDYVYLNAFSSDNYGATLPWSSRIVSFPKDKQRTSPRLEQLHMMYPSQIENTVVLPKDQEELTLAIHPQSGNATLRGQLIQGVVQEDHISLDVAASFVGATVSGSADTSVSLKIENAVVNLGASDIKSVDGKVYVNIDSFVEKFDMSILKEDGMILIGYKSDWTQRQKNALRYATDLFAAMP